MTFEQELRDSQDMWYEQGVVQGMAQGISKNKKDVVLGMREEGLSIDKISKIVKLSVSQVKDILSAS